MSTFLLNFPLPEPKFWRRHCSTGLERNSNMKFCPSLPPNQNPGAATGMYLCTLKQLFKVCVNLYYSSIV